MKRWFVLALAAVLIAGCGGKWPVDFGQASPENDPCLLKPAGEYSWLCEASAKAGVRLDVLHNLLLDSAAVAVILSDIPLDKIKKYLDKVESYLDIAVLEKKTYSWLIGMVTEDAAKEAVLASILSRRLTLFHSTQAVSSWDLHLIRLHIQHQKRSFGF